MEQEEQKVHVEEPYISGEGNFNEELNEQDPNGLILNSNNQQESLEIQERQKLEEESLEDIFEDYLKVWLVGEHNETTPMFGFLKARMDPEDGKIHDDGKNELAGPLCFDETIYDVLFSAKKYSEFEEFDKDNLKVDGIIFCNRDMNLTNPEYYFFTNFLEWGNLKALCFVDPISCPAAFHFFIGQYGSEEIQEEILEKFMQDLIVPKPQVKKRISTKDTW